MKYELLLRDILKHSERGGLVQEIPDLQEAIYVMKVCPSKCIVTILYILLIHGKNNPLGCS